MEIIAVVVLVVLMGFTAYVGIVYSNNPTIDKLKTELAQSQLREQQQFDAFLATKRTLELKEEQYNLMLGQKKSSEVKVGFLAEALAPLHENFPVKPDTCRFLGQPFDFVSFDLENDRIVFIEVKSNGSVLSPKQRKLRQIILDKKIEFAEVRVGKDGLSVK